MRSFNSPAIPFHFTAFQERSLLSRVGRSIWNFNLGPEAPLWQNCRTAHCGRALHNCSLKSNLLPILFDRKPNVTVVLSWIGRGWGLAPLSLPSHTLEARAAHLSPDSYVQPTPRWDVLGCNIMQLAQLKIIQSSCVHTHFCDTVVLSSSLDKVKLSRAGMRSLAITQCTWACRTFFLVRDTPRYCSSDNSRYLTNKHRRTQWETLQKKLLVELMIC